MFCEVPVDIVPGQGKHLAQAQPRCPKENRNCMEPIVAASVYQPSQLLRCYSVRCARPRPWWKHEQRRVAPDEAPVHDLGK
jgi:hypothetical protein